MPALELWTDKYLSEVRDKPAKLTLSRLLNVDASVSFCSKLEMHLYTYAAVILKTIFFTTLTPGQTMLR